MHLMATYLPFLMHWALSTSEKVPSPFFATSRYLCMVTTDASARSLGLRLWLAAGARRGSFGARGAVRGPECGAPAPPRVWLAALG